MRNISSWIKNHIVFTWAVISCIFAIIVHIVFSISASTEWLVAKWSAGDVLTYIGTVSLGLLAVWQNKRFKEENDISQRRLENIIAQANELMAINKIIEIEFARLERLRKAFDDFSIACDPKTFVNIYVRENSLISEKDSILSTLISIEQKIDETFFSLSRELRNDEKLRENDNNELKNSYSNYYKKAKALAKKVKQSPLEDNSSFVSELCTARDEYIPHREDYLISKEKNLHKVVYGNLSLQEIKSIYKND